MRVTFVAIVATAVAVGVLAAADPEDAQQIDSTDMELICRKSDGEELVEVHVGDITFMTSGLSFVHADGSKTIVQARDGLVELQNGTTIMAGKKIKSACRGGPFGRRGLADLSGLKSAFEEKLGDHVKPEKR